ncbi:hypothetical protein [Variovorax sp. J31P207]|uniref:hypothetical protein n=1 Tax=Variovorax sp. J31P207 TaxID=3053510 RepID=UPI002578598E|nr:hypothetical protein [Variovorax sp. J31P207]MDM0067677.1 hypothetical protein [Variovorax sp. J31P207]
MIVSIAAWAVLSANYIAVNPQTLVNRFLNGVAEPIRGIGIRLTNRQKLDEKLSQTNTEIKSKFPLPLTEGAADLYSSNLSVLFANGIRWAPRPILQSYSAYTPALAILNSDRLVSAGTNRVFFKIEPIDWRYPALEDGKTWITLLTKYRASGVASDYVVLDKATDSNRDQVEVPISSFIGRLGEEFNVPDVSGAVVASIDIQPTRLGKLATLAFAPTPLRMAVTYDNGKQAEYRYVAEMGSSTFLLSPTVSTSKEFMAMQSVVAQDYFYGHKPTSIRIFDQGELGFLWKRDFKVHLSRVRIEPNEAVDAMLFQQPIKVGKFGEYKSSPDCFIDYVNEADPNGRPISTDSDLLRLKGWAMISAKEGIQSDGVSIALVSPDGSALIYPLDKSNREDVGIHFGHPDAKMVGFEDMLNIRAVDPVTDVRIVQKGRRALCLRSDLPHGAASPRSWVTCSRPQGHAPAHRQRVRDRAIAVAALAPRRRRAITPVDAARAPVCACSLLGAIDTSAA